MLIIIIIIISSSSIIIGFPMVVGELALLEVAAIYGESGDQRPEQYTQNMSITYSIA